MSRQLERERARGAQDARPGAGLAGAGLAGAVAWRSGLRRGDRPRSDARGLAASDAWALAALGLAIAASIALCLYLTRGTTLGADEYWWFVVNKGFSVKGLLSPHNGNLMAVGRLIYAAVFALWGPNYVVLRILEVAGLAAVAALFFVFARRRVAPVVAAALAIALLFAGASPDTALIALGIPIVYSTIFGLGALIALDARSRRGDAVGCVLLCLSVATWSIGLAFAAAAVVSVLVHDDRRRRAYVVVVPVVMYVAWKVGAPKYSGPGYLAAANLQLSNVRLVPSFVVHAAAASTAAVTGLYYPFGTAIGGLGVLEHYGIGYALAGIGLVALVLRVARRRTTRSLWPALVFALAFWISIVMVIGPNREPNSTRYLYTGGLAVLLVAAEGLRGIRWRLPALAAVVVLTGLALGFNIAQLGSDGHTERFVSGAVRSVETAMELSAGHVQNNELPASLSALGALVNIGGGVRPYLAAARRYGSPAFTLAQLRRASPFDRALADVAEADITGLSLAPSAARHGACRRLGGGPAPAGSVVVRVRPPGAVLVSPRGGVVRVGRFAQTPLVTAGRLAAGRPGTLALPRDRAPEPWRVSLPAGPVSVCAL